VADLRQRSVEVVVVSSGAIALGRRILAMDTRPRDLPTLQAAIATGEDLDCRKGGMTALQWAIAFGHAKAALLLIESGANVFAEDVLGQTTLECCGASRNLSDEDAAQVAGHSLRRAAASFPSEHMERALEIATARGKQRLVKVLTGGA